jgi:hypothetical protein
MLDFVQDRRIVHGSKENHMTEEKPKIEELAAIYIKIRTAISDLKERQKEELEKLETQFDTIANSILDFCNEHNMDSVRTPAGTISRRIASRYWTNDWESMYKFIKEHDAPFLLEQRIHNGNMKQFLEDHPDELPMGLQSDRKYTVQVRKPSS